MFYKLGKKVFLFLINSIYIVQIVLIFLALFTILYWVLSLAQVGFVKPFAPLFNSINSFIHLFYNRKVVFDGGVVDFSPLVASLLMCMASWLLNFVRRFVAYVESRYDKIFNLLKSIATTRFNRNLVSSFERKEKKTKKFVILVNFSAKNLQRDSMYNKDFALGVEDMQKAVLRDFAIEFSKVAVFTSRITKDAMLFEFADFNKVDETLLNLEEIMARLREKYFRQKWEINFYVALGALANDADLNIVHGYLRMLLKLKLYNQMLCQASFKSRYEILSSRQYFVEPGGVYKIADIEEKIFEVKNIKKNVRVL